MTDAKPVFCDKCAAQIIHMDFHGQQKSVDLYAIRGLTIINDAYGAPLGTEIVTIFPLHSESCEPTEAGGDPSKGSGDDDGNENGGSPTEPPHPPTAPVVQDPLKSGDDQVVIVCYDKDGAIIGRVFASGKHTGTIEGDKVARRDSLRGDPTPDLTLENPVKKDRK